jgi:asparagine synthase (glutamine-hydrolysing)
MCGIAGIYKGGGIQDSSILKMVSELYHRGPDDESYSLDDQNFKGGMRRLSIVDVYGGSQPFTNELKTITVFYNGEIYNYKKLRKSLENDGVHFRTNCDGEVLVFLYEKYGLDFLQNLDGMFAIAIWDAFKRQLLLARDFPGEKPLYYSPLDDIGGVAFSSEINSLLSSGCISNDLDFQSIWDFPTFLWIPEPSTIYKNIKALMPGCGLLAGAGGLRHFEFKSKLQPPTYATSNQGEILSSTKKVVTDAVTSRMIGDVPMGAFLSGGLDSSIICAIASQKISNLKTFCVSFEDVEDPYHGYSDESMLASEFASDFDLSHTNLQVSADDFRDLLPMLLKSAGQPYAVSSGLGILAVAKAAQEKGIKVLLSGDGADEAFGGYSWYSSLDRVSYSCDTGEEIGQYKRFIDLPGALTDREKAIESYPQQFKAWALHYYASEDEKSKLFSSKISALSSIRYFSSENFQAPVDFLNFDRNFYFPNEMLTKVDRMTMAYSIEGRAPFASPEVQLFAKLLPWEVLVKGETLKWCLRKSFEGDLPEYVTKRKKHGFNVPIDYWLKNDWNDLLRHAFSADSALTKMGIINPSANDEMEAMLINYDVNGHVLFAFIMLNMWLEEFYES